MEYLLWAVIATLIVIIIWQHIRIVNADNDFYALNDLYVDYRESVTGKDFSHMRRDDDQ